MQAQTIAGLTVTADDLAPKGFAWPEPVAVIDLDIAPQHGEAPDLPPWPVIGIGNPAHPLAARLDTLVEPGFDAVQLVLAVRAQPKAAATLIQLLRLLPSLSVADGLVAESLAYATLQASEAHRTWIAVRESGTPTPPGRVVLTREDDRAMAMLDRAEAGNAIDRPMRDALHEAFALVNLDPTISSITLRGAGRTFSLGADLAEFGTTRDPAMAHAIRMRTLPALEAARCGERFVAEIDGACVGSGLELAAFAGRITATARSWFQLPELAMGIIPGAGGCVSLTRRIGRQRTALMVLSGRRIPARKALEWGLIDAIVDQPSARDGGDDAG
ncbi:enoyl-CoA hydratase/isomerase family protein [Novosphingobium kaempferiae]|uniref:enoyl-CoA hydratase/isomerase family protein n=1 Tax=Novosphingobium kaempferiae TaxID=2896849 RepID=UPI001E4AF7DA|nr:enoyl-CoA hydratase/isomerase family protein [Novosphingobium kaempferiae]